MVADAISQNFNFDYHGSGNASIDYERENVLSWRKGGIPDIVFYRVDMGECLFLFRCVHKLFDSGHKECINV
jgi:hypothetical protein